MANAGAGASEHRERATRTERAGEAARETPRKDGHVQLQEIAERAEIAGQA